MTGFRVALGGAQALYGVAPDLTTLGKIIGGGMPVGAYGGRREHYGKCRTRRPDLSGRHAVGQSGRDGRRTGDAGIDPGSGLLRGNRAQAPRLLTDGCSAAAIEAGVPFSTNRVGGMFGLFFTDAKVETYTQATACDGAAFNRFFHAMLERGVYLAPSAFEAGFMSSAHSDQDIADTLDAARQAFRKVKNAHAS